MPRDLTSQMELMQMPAVHFEALLALYHEGYLVCEFLSPSILPQILIVSVVVCNI